MRAVVYHHGNSKIDLAGDSICLRLGIMLAAEICYSGQGYNYLRFNEYFTPTNFEQKLKLLINASTKILDLPHDDLVETALMNKAFKKKIGKTKEEIVAFKRIEKGLDDLFIKYKEHLSNSFKQSGMIQLEKMFNREYFITVCQLMNQNEMEDVNNNCVPISQMLTLEKTYYESDTYVVKSNPPVFFLQPEFLSLADWTGNNSNAQNIEFKPRYKYIHSLFKLTSPIQITFNELESIRNELMHSTNSFQNEIDGWLNYIYEEGKNGEDILTEKVIPTCTFIQKRLDENLVLNHYAEIGTEKYLIEIFAGEAQLEDIWNFYDSFNGIAEETKTRLNELKNSNEKYQRLYPFIAIKSLKSTNPDTTINLESELKPIKKNLDIG